LKNWSLISNPKSSEVDYQLAPCYDLICSKLYFPGEDESALTVNGKRNRISVSDFAALAEYLKIDKKAYQSVIYKIKDLRGIFLEMIENAVYFEKKDKLKEILIGNYSKLFRKTI